MARLILATALLLATTTPVRAQSSGEDPATEDSVEQPAIDPRVDCIIAKESGGLDVYNRQGSGATGPGQYMPSTWRAHTAEMGEPWLNIHSLADVRRVASYDLSMGRRRQWTVGGCG